MRFGITRSPGQAMCQSESTGRASIIPSLVFLTNGFVVEVVVSGGFQVAEGNLAVANAGVEGAAPIGVGSIAAVGFGGTLALDAG